MKKIAIAFLLFFCTASYAQENQSIHMWIKKDSTMLFIDNSNANWYTLEIETDTLIEISLGLYQQNKKTIQFSSVNFPMENDNGAKGDSVAERIYIEKHQAWEFDYQRNNLPGELKCKKKWYVNSQGKPFLIWWYPLPEFDENELIVGSNPNNTSSFDATEPLSKYSHMVFMCFMVNGYTNIGVSQPVAEHERLENVIENMEQMANTLKAYGGIVNPDALIEQENNSGVYSFEDSLKIYSVRTPEWFKVIYHTQGENVLIGTLPEKNNIINSIALNVTYETNPDALPNLKFRDLDYFNSKYEDFKVIEDSENIWRYVHTYRNKYYHREVLIAKVDAAYIYLNFVATASTYDFNKERLDVFVNAVLHR